MEELRSFDRKTAETTLLRLEESVRHHRQTHKDDTGIKNRLARIAVLRLQIAADKKRVKECNRALEDIIAKEEARKGDGE